MTRQVRPHKRGIHLKQAKIKQFIPLLEQVAKRRKGFKIILQHPSKDLVGIFCNCARNLIKGNIPVSPSQLKKLRPHKNNIRKLAGPGSLNVKKKIIQKGGFLPILAAGALGSLLPNLLGGLLGGGRITP